MFSNGIRVWKFPNYQICAVLNLFGKHLKAFICNFRSIIVKSGREYLNHKDKLEKLEMLDLIPDYVKNAPFYHLAIEAFLLVWILWLIFRKSYSPAEKSKLTEKVRLKTQRVSFLET